MSVAELASRCRENISKVIIGKDDAVNMALICLFSGGHLLLEDIPGTGKTTLAKAIAKSVDCSFKRIQFTPDLLPSDITGINIYNRKEDCFEFKKGPAFTNILLADEINRATPRTQSSLLECMEEKQITVDSITYPLNKPFMVIATQNPVEIQGTFPLPEAQLDRFFMCLSLGYPDKQNEKNILDSSVSGDSLEELSAVASAEKVIAAQEEIKKIIVSDEIKNYIIEIAEASRNNQKIRLGLSTRGTLALMKASQGFAALNGRDYVLPDDVKAVAYSVISHRLLIKGYTYSQGISAKDITDEIINTVPVPRED